MQVSTSRVTLNSGPTRWIITPSIEPSRLLCMSNRHILRSILSYITFGSLHICPPFPCSIPQIYACHREDRRAGTEHTSGGYLGPISTVADSQRRGVLEALQTIDDMLLILTDSMAAKSTAINLAKGAAARSQIERDIKEALQRQQAQ